MRKLDTKMGFRELESKYNHFSSTLSFVSILKFVLHSISSDFKSYDHYSIIEMIFNKLHIEVF